MKKLLFIPILLILTACTQPADQAVEPAIPSDVALEEEAVDQEIIVNVEDSEEAPKTTEDDDEGIIVNKEKFESGTFAYKKASGYYGNLFVSGYSVIIERNKGFCQVDCDTVNYVFLRVLETGSEVVSEYIEEWQGNAFIGEETIGLGCVEDGLIHYKNETDVEMIDVKLSEEFSTAILEATEENPIVIELERFLPFSGGRGAPDCYSHFARIEAVK